VQASHSSHKGRPREERTEKQYTAHPYANTQPEHQHNIIEKISHQTRTQYSRHTGEHHQKFDSTKHKGHDNEKKKERKEKIYIPFNTNSIFIFILIITV
jgi:hypothetical protein